MFKHARQERALFHKPTIHPKEFGTQNYSEAATPDSHYGQPWKKDFTDYLNNFLWKVIFPRKAIYEGKLGKAKPKDAYLGISAMPILYVTPY